MPYMVEGKGVYKKNADGSRGELVKMHMSHEEAVTHMKALYANVEDAKEESIKSLRTSDVRELVDLSEATLDEGRKAVRVRLIQAGWSKNNRYYPADALAQAAPLWEGVKAYADHPGKQEAKDRPERSVRDIVGIYENVAHDPDGSTRADFRVLGEAQGWLWPLIQESVGGGKTLLGLSINALGTTRKGEMDGRKGEIVEAITHANSVDVVTEPAAGGGFERLLASEDGGWTQAVFQAMTVEELREARPDILDSLKREWKTTRDTQALQDARAENEKLAAELVAAAQREQELAEQLRTSEIDLARTRKAALVDRLLAGRKLPEKWLNDVREALLAAPDEDAMVAILDREREKAAAVRPPVAVRGAGVAAPRPAPTAPPLRRGNPVLESLGLEAVAPPGMSPAEWKQRKQRLLENKEG